MAAYYNEIDKFAAAWLRELIKHGHIADGEVDERSIKEVETADLAGFSQCHFFAGIGGWSYALRIAGWDDTRPVWTGSCPCQPFSAAGNGLGTADERHLWPELHRLIAECRPTVCFGEQVSGQAGLDWLDHVSTDLEASDYACGAVTFPASSCGAFHIRQRLYWVAHAECEGPQGRCCTFSGKQRQNGQNGTRGTENQCVNMGTNGLRGSMVQHTPMQDGGHGLHMPGDTPMESISADKDKQPWSNPEWLWCRDEQFRPVEPGTYPLADGIPARVGRLRGYGNAIVPQQAAQFIGAYMDTKGEE